MMNNNKQINYEFDFARYNEHLVDVTIHFTAQQHQSILWLPSWIAGSYLIREFSRHVTTVFYRVHDQVFRAIKLSKNEWQLPEVGIHDEVTVYYEVYCYDLSVRTAYIDQTRLYGNFSAMALTISGQEQQSIEVTLKVPEQFLLNKDAKATTLACGLSSNASWHHHQHHYQLYADSYDELIDYPFEIAEQAQFSFTVTDKYKQSLTHRFFPSGRTVLTHQA